MRTWTNAPVCEGESFPLDGVVWLVRNRIHKEIVKTDMGNNKQRMQNGFQQAVYEQIDDIAPGMTLTVESCEGRVDWVLRDDDGYEGRIDYRMCLDASMTITNEQQAFGLVITVINTLVEQVVRERDTLDNFQAVREHILPKVLRADWLIENEQIVKTWGHLSPGRSLPDLTNVSIDGERLFKQPPFLRIVPIVVGETGLHVTQDLMDCWGTTPEELAQLAMANLRARLSQPDAFDVVALDDVTTDDDQPVPVKGIVPKILPSPDLSSSVILVPDLIAQAMGGELDSNGIVMWPVTSVVVLALLGQNQEHINTVASFIASGWRSEDSIFREYGQPLMLHLPLLATDTLWGIGLDMNELMDSDLGVLFKQILSTLASDGMVASDNPFGSPPANSHPELN